MDVVQRFFIKGEADAGQAKSELKELQTSMNTTGNAAGQFNLKLLNIDAAMNLVGKAINAGEKALRSYFTSTEEGALMFQKLERQAGDVVGTLVELAIGTNSQRESFETLSTAIFNTKVNLALLLGVFNEVDIAQREFAANNKELLGELAAGYKATQQGQYEAVLDTIAMSEEAAAKAYIAANPAYFWAKVNDSYYDVKSEQDALYQEILGRVLSTETTMRNALAQTVAGTESATSAGETYGDAIERLEGKARELWTALNPVAQVIEETGQTSEQASTPVRQLTEDFRALDNAMKSAMGGVGAGLEHGGDIAGILGAIDRARGEQQVRAQTMPGMFAEEDAMNLGAMIAGTAEQIPDHADMAIESLNGMQSAALSMGETMAQAFGMAATSAEDFSIIAGNAMLKGIGTMATTMGHFFILAGLGQSVPGLTWNPGAGALIGIGTAMEIFGAAIGGVNVGGGGGGVSAGTRSTGAAGINRGPSQSIQLDSQTVVMLDGEVIARSVQRQHSLGGVGRNG